MVDKSENLNELSFVFKKHSKRLKNEMWWRNTKMIAIIAGIVLVSKQRQSCAALDAASHCTARSLSHWLTRRSLVCVCVCVSASSSCSTSSFRVDAADPPGPTAKPLLTHHPHSHSHSPSPLPLAGLLSLPALLHTRVHSNSRSSRSLTPPHRALSQSLARNRIVSTSEQTRLPPASIQRSSASRRAQASRHACFSS